MNYYSLLTKLGQALDVTAKATGVPVQLTEIAVGDGGGVAVSPSEAQTALVREKWRGALTAIYPDAENENWIIVEAVVPEAQGGWYIREIGVFTSAGHLYAVGNVPESYKPQLAEGVGMGYQVRMRLAVSNASSVVLLIDPSVVLASKNYVNTEVARVRTDLDELQEDFGDHVTDPEAHPDIRALIEAIEIPVANTSQAGIARRATAAEVLAGEATTPYVCPADLMAALLAGLAGVARLGAVGAYTRQHYAVPVVLAGQGGDVQLDAELHQDVDITAIGALNMLAPLHPARGMYLTITLRAASALAITWAAAFASNKDVALPTAFVAGKALVLQFRCMDGVNWMLIGRAEGA